MFFTRAEQHVFVDGHAVDPVVFQRNLPGAGEALDFVGIHFDTTHLVVRDFAGIHLVVEIILALDPNGAGLELHVDILRNEHHGSRVVLHQQ